MTAWFASPSLSGTACKIRSWLRKLKQFRDELAEVGQAERIDWIDFSAPPNGCCFALGGPMAVLRETALKSPKLLSPKFAEMFDSAKYQFLSIDKFRMHFQYLMSHERAVSHDFFLITAADQALPDRFSRTASLTDSKALRPFKW